MCPTLCDPLDCSTAGFPVFHRLLNLLKLMSIELVMLSSHFILYNPFSFFPYSCPVLGSFPVNRLLASGGRSIEASASSSVLPMNIQGWSPLELASLIFLLSNELSRVFSSTTIQRGSAFFLCGPALTSIHDYWKNHSFDCTNLCQWINVSAF